MNIFQRLREHHRFRESIFLGILTLICVSLSIFRLVYSETRVFFFLNWNLFLAFVPWALTSITISSRRVHARSHWVVFILMGIWLLFFPNAPYILTDLFHLRYDQLTMPIWFDLVLILAYAWTGLLFGFLSLWDIERLLAEWVHPKLVTALSVSLLFLGSFGIYLGRYLRWNSWDLITEPFRLIYDIGDRIVNPFEHPRAWGMTISMGIFLNMIYWSFHFIRNRSSSTDS